MTAATMKIERSGPAIRVALAEYAAEDCAVFEADLRQALARAAASFDLAPAEARAQVRILPGAPKTWATSTAGRLVLEDTYQV